MPETTPQDPAPQDSTPAPAAPSDQQQPATGDEPLGEPGKKALEAERTRAVEAEKRAKQLERELEQHRQASMSEAEKAVAEAEKRGEQKATQQWSQRLVRSDFIAAASRRNAEFDASAVLDDLNLDRFIGDDGEPNPKAIAAAVERLVPEPSGSPRPPSFDGGARTTAPASTGMNGLIRAGLRR